MDKDTKEILASMGINADHLARKVRIAKVREKARLEAEEKAKLEEEKAAKEIKKHKYSRKDE